MTGPRYVRVPEPSVRIARVPEPGTPRTVRQGIPGPTGPPGTSEATVSYHAVLAEDGSVYSAVVSNADGLWLADPTNPEHAGRINGVLGQSGVRGQRVRVVLAGLIPGWGGPQGRLWCGPGGQPVQVAVPGMAWRQILAFSPESGAFVVQLKPVIVAPSAP